MAATTVVIDDFSGGELGLQRPNKNAPTFFKGNNVWRYPDGGIGPRPAVTRVTTSGDAVKALAVYQFNWLNQEEKFVSMFSDKRAQAINTSGAVNTGATAMTNAPEDSLEIDGQVLYVSEFGFGAVFDGFDVTDLTAMPSAARIEQFKQRYIVTDGVTFWFSDPNSFSNWPAANFFFLPETANITDIWIQRNSVIVTDLIGNIYRISGTLGVNETLTKVGVGPVYNRAGVLPYRPGGGAALDGDIWYSIGNRLVRFDGATPVSRPGFDPPATGLKVPNASFWSDTFWVRGPDTDEFLLLQADQSDPDLPYNEISILYHHADGAFTRHTVPVATFTPSNAKVLGAYAPRLQKFMFVANGGSGTAPKYYQMPNVLDDVMPSATNDGDSGAPVTASLVTNDWVAPEGQEIRVRAVIVDYSVDLNNTNAFNLSVDAIPTYDSTDIRTSTVQAFVSPNPTIPVYADYPNIVRGRQVFRIGDQAAAGGFRINVNDWTGVKIHGFVVVGDVSEVRI